MRVQMNKKIIVIILILVLICIGGFLLYKKFYNPNPSEEEILKGIEEKDKIRNELSNVIAGNPEADENYEISISEAREKAIIIFNSLGESNLNKDSVNVREVNKNGDIYYHISSPRNSAEIEVKTGRITKINGVVQ